MERVMIFIDGSNFYYGLKDTLGHAHVDFASFCELLCSEGRRLVHTHYYNVPVRQSTDPDQYARQQRFFALLRLIPHFTLHLGRLVDRDRQEKCPACDHEYTVAYRIEKGVDVQLATHMLAFAFDDQYDTAILVSQDGDFVPAVEEVCRLRKKVENADFAQRLPSYLSKRCSAPITLTPGFLKPCVKQGEP